MAEACAAGRFDLLEQGGAVATHSWELDRLGLVGGPGLEAATLVGRSTPRADFLWPLRLDP